MRMSRYIKRKSKEFSLVFAIGDGNHSLAAAKICYEEGFTSRYAMVELENLHDDALKFEPIHRIIKGINPDEIINDIQNEICVKGFAASKNSWALKFYSHDKKGIIHIDKSKGASALTVIQKYLDDKNFEIDYIHDIFELQLELKHLLIYLYE